MHRMYTVRQTLLCIVLVLVIPGSLIELAWLREELRANQAHSDAATLQAAQNLLWTINDEFNAVGAVAKALADTTALQTGDFADFHRQASAATHYTNVNGFILSNRHGQQLVNTNASYGVRLASHDNPALLERIIARCYTQIPNFRVITNIGSGALSICVPVLMDGEVKYVLDARLASADLARLLSRRQLPADWMVSIVDSSGTIAASSRSPERLVGAQAPATLLRLIGHTPQGRARIQTPQGVSVDTTHVRSLENGWAVAISVPRVSIDSDLQQILVCSIGGSLMLLAAGVYLAGRASMPIRQSMAQLVQMTEVLGHGSALSPRRMQLREADQVAGALTAASIELEQLRLAAIAFESTVPMMITDSKNMIVRINSAFTASTGYTEEDVLGHTPQLLKSGRHDRGFYAAMWESILQHGTWQGECWDRRKNGDIYPTWTVISAIGDHRGAIGHYVCAQSDISGRKQTEEEIRQLAFYDPLTKLPNRRLLIDRLGQAINHSSRTTLIGALMFIDLDNFKMLNDTLGHDQGDVLLRQVAERLPTCVRSVDTVARLGGDEFVIMLEGLSDQVNEATQKAQDIGSHVLTELNRPYTLADRQYLCTPSIGVTLIHDHHLTVDEALRHADLAMYQAKAAGRNTLRFFEPYMQQAVNARVELEHELRHALKHGEFELYYQPQVDPAGQLIGAEGLLRWHHPSKGLLLPDQFIALAESTGIILPLGHWILESACEQLARWANEPGMQHLNLAINVSPRQFKQPEFVAQVADALYTSGALPQRLKLELTENLMLDDFAGVAEKMHALKRTGISFALDDFGVGYSSLSYLNQLPLDQLKIDRSFARDMLIDSHDAAIARVIVVLGHSLGLTILAEGVETAEQHAFLTANHCNAFQGFLFSHPLPEAAFRAFAAQQSFAD